MWYDNGAEIINGVITWEQILYVVTKNAVYVSAFDAISKFKKLGDVYLEFINR